MDRALAEHLENRRESLDPAAVPGAAASLEALLHGGMPDYVSPEVCLGYLFHYQFKQVNLAAGLFRERLGAQSDWTEGGLYLADFAAGALAAAFGLILAVADLESSGFPVGKSRLQVDAFDPSGLMLLNGRDLLWVWRRLLGESTQYAPLSRVFSRMGMRLTREPNRFGRVAAKEEAALCWLTSFHALYSGNFGDVGAWLAAVAGRLQPAWTLITTNDSKRDLGADVAASLPVSCAGPFDPGEEGVLGNYMWQNRAAAVSLKLGFVPERWHRKDRLYCTAKGSIYWESG